MNPVELIRKVEARHIKETPPVFRVGDTVDVAVKIPEGEGKDAKDRIQIFSGTVIARKGYGINASFTVRKIIANEGVERIFLLHSPKIGDVVVRRSGKTRRAKLFYLRDRVGKATRLREIKTDDKVAKTARAQAAAAKSGGKPSEAVKATAEETAKG